MDWGIMEMEEMEEKGKGMVQKMERLTAREKMEVFVVCCVWKWDDVEWMNARVFIGVVEGTYGCLFKMQVAN